MKTVVPVTSPRVANVSVHNKQKGLLNFAYTNMFFDGTIRSDWKAYGLLLYQEQVKAPEMESPGVPGLDWSFLIYCLRMKEKTWDKKINPLFYEVVHYFWKVVVNLRAVDAVYWRSLIWLSFLKPVM